MTLPLILHPASQLAEGLRCVYSFGDDKTSVIVTELYANYLLSFALMMEI
jgi:hypothetical protein